MAAISVTGGARFISSNLCEYLLNKINEVICLDNFFPVSEKSVSNLLELDNEKFEIIRHDLIKLIYSEVDQIYNLACPTSPVHYQWVPIKTLLAITVRIYNRLGIAERCKARILQAPTSEAYSNSKEHPQKETYWGNVNTIGTRSYYD